jgi:hypothetical protein
MRPVLIALAGYLVAAAAAVVLAVAAGLAFGHGPVLARADRTVAGALVELVAAVAMVGAPGWILARGALAVAGLHAPWAFALAGAAAAMLGLALLPGMPFSFAIIGTGAVAGVVAGMVERGMAR